LACLWNFKFAWVAVKFNAADGKIAMARQSIARPIATCHGIA